MTGASGNALERVKEYTNYVDVLSYALAMTMMTRFTSDTGKWHEAVDKLVERFGGIVEELYPLRGSFDRKPGFAPHSDQVEHWLHVLSMSGFLDRPMHGDWRLEPPKRVIILRKQSQRLGYIVEQIREMVKVLREELKP